MEPHCSSWSCWSKAAVTNCPPKGDGAQICVLRRTFVREVMALRRNHLHRHLGLSLAFVYVHSTDVSRILMSRKARERQDLDDRDNFIRARDNEADHRYLGTGWVRFRDFDIVEKTEHNVHVCAKRRDPGLGQPRKLPDGSEGQRYSAGWLFWDDNSLGMYAPLIDEPDLFVKFASLARKDPGTRDGQYDIMLEWIKNYGVLGLVPEGNFAPGLRSERKENLLAFWHEVHRAAACMALYEAATGRGRMLKRLSLPGKTLTEKRKSAARTLSQNVQHTLERHCYPKLYYQVRQDSDETPDVGLSWGFHSLLGAMYLQMAWRMTSRRCEAPGCNKIIGLHERSDKKTCSPACKERRRQHRN